MLLPDRACSPHGGLAPTTAMRRYICPAGFAADLDLQTDAGHVTVDFPYTIIGTPDQSRIQGKMNSAGEDLVLRTSGGNIKVLKNKP
jgi:hypothetical protein